MPLIHLGIGINNREPLLRIKLGIYVTAIAKMRVDSLAVPAFRISIGVGQDRMIPWVVIAFGVDDVGKVLLIQYQGSPFAGTGVRIWYLVMPDYAIEPGVVQFDPTIDQVRVSF